MRIGIIGFGAIGTFIGKNIADNTLHNFTVAKIFDTDTGKNASVKEIFKKDTLFTNDFNEFLNTDMEFVVESASQEAVSKYIPLVVKKGISCLVMSGGALSNQNLLKLLQETASATGAKIHIPSGAISGIDGLSAMKFAGIKQVQLITRKNPRSLSLPPGTQKLIFEGHPEEATRKFPKNINVAMAIALATEHPEKVSVKILSDPDVHTNRHEIIASGNSGTLHIIVDNKPFPENPKTSFLAALSALQILEKIGSNLIIGG